MLVFDWAQDFLPSELCDVCGEPVVERPLMLALFINDICLHERCVPVLKEALKVADIPPRLDAVGAP